MHLILTLTPRINLAPLPPPPSQVRVLVTHGIGFLSQCDRVVSLKEGGITEVGTYACLPVSMVTAFTCAFKRHAHFSDH